MGGPHCWWSLVIIWMESWLVLIQCIFCIFMLSFPGLSDTSKHFFRDIIHDGGFCVSCVVPVGRCSYVLSAPGSGPFCNIEMSYAWLYTHTSYFGGAYVLVVIFVGHVSYRVSMRWSVFEF